MNQTEIIDKAHYKSIEPDKGVPLFDWFEKYNNTLSSQGVYKNRYINADIPKEELYGHDFFHMILGLTKGVPIFDHITVPEDLSKMYSNYRMVGARVSGISYMLAYESRSLDPNEVLFNNLHIFPKLEKIVRDKLDKMNIVIDNLAKVPPDVKVEIINSNEFQYEKYILEEILPMEKYVVQSLFQILDRFINVLQEQGFKVKVIGSVASFVITGTTDSGEEYNAFEDPNFYYDVVIPSMNEVRRMMPEQFQTIYKHSAPALSYIYGMTDNEIASYLEVDTDSVSEWVNNSKKKLIA
jgi:hypothetical protein